MPRARKTTPPETNETIVAWATALVEGGGERASQKWPPPWRGDPLERVVTRFGLDTVESTIFALLVAVERSFTLSQRLVVLDVAKIAALCERAGAGLVEEVIARLGPRGRLRAHALMATVEDRLVGAADPLRLEVGLVPLAAADAELEGVTRIVPSAAERAPFVQRLGGKVPAVVTLELPSAGTEAATASAIADGLGREVLWWASVGADAGRARRLRRRADLDGAVLVISGAAAPLAFLLAPPPAAIDPTPLVVLLGVPVEERQVPASWTLRRDKVVVEAARTAGPITELDRIRALAQRDADRALGISRPEPPPRPVVPGRIVDSSVRVVEAKPEPPPAQAPPPPAPTPPTPAAAVPLTMAESGPINVDSGPIQIGVTALTPPAAVADSGPLAVDSPPVPDGERIDLPAEASIEMRARAAVQSASASQRIELLQSLAGVKSPSVVAALRHNVKSEHAGLRQVAETMMTAIFGASWNRSRAIARPVQPPHSEE